MDRHLEAKEVLLKVMRIAEDNDLIRSDVEGIDNQEINDN